MTQLPNLKSKILNLPPCPGVYQFFDKARRVLYVGKAKNLRARVAQYFRGSDKRPQIPFLMKEIASFDYTVVNTELESLYLERTLIQKHHPKYNIELKNEKNYAFIVIDYSSEIPQVAIRRHLSEQDFEFAAPRQAREDHAHPSLLPERKSANREAHNLKAHKNTYFGPFTSPKKIRELISTARRVFGLCGASKIGKPCFHFHLHRCPGVCVGLINSDDYRQHLEKIKLFFTGRTTPAMHSIRAEMHKMAAAKKFEQAARLRDQLRALEVLEQKQNVIMAKPVEWDIVGMANNENIWCVNLFKIRQGKMLDKSNFIYDEQDLCGRTNPAHHQNAIVLQNFLEDYYLKTSDAPKKILVPSKVKNERLIKTLLKDRFGLAVEIVSLRKSKAGQLVRLSQINAQEYLKNYLSEKARRLDKIQKGLTQLKEILKLPAIPKRIESFDISNLQGTNPVGSMVVFVDGLPKKSEYRKFKIHSKDTPDDFAMMREMLSRRLNRIMNQESGTMHKDRWPVPDLVVIDGGKGQLGIAVSIIYDSKFMIPVIGLAKRVEEIFIPHQKAPIILPPDSPALQLLQNLRDEAHRFGITFHRKLRSQQAVKSALDDIAGIGPKIRKRLKGKFGTVASIKKANWEDLTQAVGKKLAERIKNKLS